MAAAATCAVRRTTHVLDDAGRVIRTGLPDPDTINSGAAAPVWTFAYNADGDLASQTDPVNQGTGNSAVFVYDDHHRLLTQTAPLPVAGSPRR